MKGHPNIYGNEPQTEMCFFQAKSKVNAQYSKLRQKRRLLHKYAVETNYTIYVALCTAR